MQGMLILPEHLEYEQNCQSFFEFCEETTVDTKAQL
jgi:hypothetical protein